MKNILIKDGKTVDDAKKFFNEVIISNGLQNHTVKEFKEKVFLKYMTDPLGWLSSWMLKSDELCALITGSRMWDVYYVRDSEAMRLMISVDSFDMKDKQSISTESYHSYPLADDIGVPLSMKFAIANLAFKETIILEPGNQVDIKMTNGFYDIQKPLENGEVLPFQSPTHLTAFHLNKYIFEVNRGISNGLDLSKDMNV